MARSYIFRAAAMAALVATGSIASAQYPQVPADIQEAANAAKGAANQRSDEAFDRAQAAMKADEANGRYYYPWATVPGDLPQAGIPAFPGAEGGGMYSHGGRGGKVFVVTSLEDSGPGTFREACEAGGARIVVFNVSGIIRLKERIRIRAPFITIDGSRAPGNGVCIAGDTVELESHDIVIRHMRFRRGETSAGDRNDSIGGNPIGNVIIDHVSASWGLDENMSMYRHMYRPRDGSRELKLPTVNITIQNSIFSEGLNIWNHAFGATIGGYNSTFMRNLFACNTGRNPSVGMNGDVGLFNNVMFNWVHRTIDGGDHKSYYNVVNNYFKPGPATPLEKPISYRVLKPEARRGRDAPVEFGKAYVGGNIVEGNERVTADNWDGGVQLDSAHNAEEVLPKVRVKDPFQHAPVTLVSAREAYDYVLENAGATLPRRDAVDARIVETVRTGKINVQPPPADFVARLEQVKFAPERIAEIQRLATLGIIVDPSQVGGYPEYKGTPHVDTDGDGMPDEYETKRGLNPNDASDASQGAPNGYTNIEKYLYGIE